MRHCGNYIEQQFGATHTCKEGDWQCTSCKDEDQEEEIASLKAQLAECKKDAERYQFLRNNPDFSITYTGELTLDQHVDAAISERISNDT